MRGLARRFDLPPGLPAADIVGTGGDGSGSLNLSTGAALLAAASRTRKALPPPDERFALIAGTGRETLTGLRARDGKLQFRTSEEGDGTVPLTLAHAVGAPYTCGLRQRDVDAGDGVAAGPCGLRIGLVQQVGQCAGVG